MRFKYGDRVEFTGPTRQGDQSDFGTILDLAGNGDDLETIWWVEWDNGEFMSVKECHLKLLTSSNTQISVSAQQNNFSVKEMKDLLNKMDDSIQLSFTDLKIHFG